VKNIVEINGVVIVIEVNGIGKTVNEYAPKIVETYRITRGRLRNLRESHVKTSKKILS